MPHEPRRHHRTCAGCRPLDRSKWIGWTVAALIGWGVVYSQLVPFSDWVVASTHVDPNSHLGDAINFFAYDTPKVLMLLTLVVFGMGVVRSFFSPEKTRALLAGKREGIGNVLAASLGIVTPFCSCSAVPLFIGFVSAGVPLGVTFSFLISAPMVNEVALGLLFGLVGWKVALTYLAFGLAVAIVSGWVIGRLHLEHWLEEWVRNIRSSAIELPPEELTVVDRIKAGIDAVREIVGKVWPWIIAGIAVGAFIHGYVPADLLATIMGRGAWWSVPAAVLDWNSNVFERRRDHPRGRGTHHQRCRTRDSACVHDVSDCVVTPRDDHPAQGSNDPADRRVRRRRRHRYLGGRLSVQRAVFINRTEKVHERRQSSRSGLQTLHHNG